MLFAKHIYMKGATMDNDTIKLLNLDRFNLKIEKLETTKINNILECHITLINNHDKCPFCNSNKTIIKGYYKKKIAHAISTNSPCFIIYNARRFVCKECNSSFYEHNPFSYKYDKSTVYSVYTVLEALKDHTSTFKNVANRFHLSSTTVIRYFDTYIDAKRRKLPDAICIDEFYTSKKRQYKYACVFLDFDSKKIIDVYPSRRKDKLSQQISYISVEERKNVKYVIIDMWDTYRDISKIYFPKALIAVDSFHIISHLNDAMDTIRIKIMRKYDKRTTDLSQNDKFYFMLKKFHYFFTKDFDNIYNGDINIKKLNVKWNKHEIRNYLFSIDDDLKTAYILKERYREFNLTASYDNCDAELEELIDEFLNSKFEEFRGFGCLLLRWKNEIKNSFIKYNNKRLSNGPIEGANSKIKTILKSGNGYPNFNRLRNRIMFSLNKDIPYNGNPKENKK